jgi:hypothetical protein
MTVAGCAEIRFLRAPYSLVHPRGLTYAGAGTGPGHGTKQSEIRENLAAHAHAHAHEYD